ncbi:hypothetical protein CCMA1212_003176, partial [Trichoderma ghanense]
ASQNIYQGGQHPFISSSSFLFLSKFCQLQIHLSVSFPPCLFLFVCSGAGLPPNLLIPYLVLTHTNPSPVNYTIKHLSCRSA